MNKLVYLACPYSDPDPAVREERFRAVNRAAGILMRAGLYIFSPISHTHPIAMEAGLPLGFDYWRGYDEAILSVCKALIILELPGYGQSVGVRAERDLAQDKGIPIFYSQPDFGALLETARRVDPYLTVKLKPQEQGE
jgi:Domain of unknown function (DUF1937)